MIDVCLLGTGGMMPLPQRALTALMVRYNGTSILIDCGEGTQVAVKKCGWSFKPIDAICFTHYHADHISGLPGLLLTLGNAERTEPLLMIGPKRLEKVVTALRTIAPELPFPIVFHELQETEECMDIHGLKLTAFRVNHNVTCYGYSLELNRAGRFEVEKARANQVPMNCWSPLQKQESVVYEGVTYTQDMVLGETRKGLKLTYCTDTRPTESIVRNAAHSDLFICEGMYGEDGKEAKAREYKHMTMYEAAEIAKQADVKEMWLTHYSPSLVHPEQFESKVKQVFSNTIISRDGRVCELKFEEE